MIQTLAGLHAAHEATSDQGEPLEIVHRDVSPRAEGRRLGLQHRPRVARAALTRAA